MQLAVDLHQHSLYYELNTQLLNNIIYNFFMSGNSNESSIQIVRKLKTFLNNNTDENRKLFNKIFEYFNNNQKIGKATQQAENKDYAPITAAIEITEGKKPPIKKDVPYFSFINSEQILKDTPKFIQNMNSVLEDLKNIKKTELALFHIDNKLFAFFFKSMQNTTIKLIEILKGGNRDNVKGKTSFRINSVQNCYLEYAGRLQFSDQGCWDMEGLQESHNSTYEALQKEINSAQENSVYILQTKLATCLAEPYRQKDKDIEQIMQKLNLMLWELFYNNEYGANFKKEIVWNSTGYTKNEIQFYSIKGGYHIASGNGGAKALNATKKLLIQQNWSTFCNKEFFGGSKKIKDLENPQLLRRSSTISDSQNKTEDEKEQELSTLQDTLTENGENVYAIYKAIFIILGHMMMKEDKLLEDFDGQYKKRISTLITSMNSTNHENMQYTNDFIYNKIIPNLIEKAKNSPPKD